MIRFQDLANGEGVLDWTGACRFVEECYKSRGVPRTAEVAESELRQACDGPTVFRGLAPLASVLLDGTVKGVFKLGKKRLESEIREMLEQQLAAHQLAQQLV